MVAEAPPMIRGSEQSIISAALVFIVALCVLKLKICAGTCDSVNSTLHEEAGSVGSGEPELCLMCRHVGFFMGGGGGVPVGFGFRTAIVQSGIGSSIVS